MITLKNVLITNAASCIIFGLIFLLIPTEVALFLSADAPAPDVILLIVGAVLVVNGLHLAWASTQQAPNQFLIWYFSMGDFLWGIGSVILLVGQIWITTSVGITATILVGTVVVSLGVMQLIKVKVK